MPREYREHFGEAVIRIDLTSTARGDVVGRRVDGMSGDTGKIPASHLLAVWPWASSLTTLSSSDLFPKLRITDRDLN